MSNLCFALSSPKYICFPCLLMSSQSAHKNKDYANPHNFYSFLTLVVKSLMKTNLVTETPQRRQNVESFEWNKNTGGKNILSFSSLPATGSTTVFGGGAGPPHHRERYRGPHHLLQGEVATYKREDLQSLISGREAEDRLCPSVRGNKDPNLDFSEKLISRGKFPLERRSFEFIMIAIIIIMITIITKEDKKDAALCLLPKELEGTDLGVAAAAQAFK